MELVVQSVIDMNMLAAASLASITAVMACDTSEPASTYTNEDVIRAPSTTIAALAKNPDRYDGQTIRVLGEVDARLDARVFVLRDRSLLWAPKIPVIARTPQVFDSSRLADGDAVEVRGIARTRLPADLARELGSATTQRIGKGPYIVAGSVERLP